MCIKKTTFCQTLAIPYKSKHKETNRFAFVALSPCLAFTSYAEQQDDEGNQGQTSNGEFQTYLWKTGASLFTKVYNSQSPDVKETNQFIGLGYTHLKTEGWWFKPCIAQQCITVHSNSGPTYDIDDLNIFTVSWNKIDSNDDFASNNYSANDLNGGLNIIWKIMPHISTTLMYRYFYNKLGADGYGDIVIYRLAYNF